MESVFSPHWHLVWMAAALFLMAYIGSPRQQGRIAYRQVRRLLEQALERSRYSQFHSISLPAGGGTQDFDHVVVSRNGIFVIVSEYRPGQIKGGESQEFWKQWRFGGARTWPNPVYRAKIQMETLEKLLGFPRSRFHVVVAVGGQKPPLKGLPGQVMLTSEVARFIRSKADPLLSPEQAEAAAAKIRAAMIERSRGSRLATITRLALAVAVAVGVYSVYGDTLRSFFSDFENRIEQLAAPERFDEAGQRKTEQEVFEESLICAFSEDSMRCSCYHKGGEKVEIGLAKCREIAERGSILKQ